MKKVLFLLVFCALLVRADIIPANRRATWSGNVGIPGGIPARAIIGVNIVTDLGADPTGATDTSQIMLDAWAACPSGQVVYCPAGTYRIDYTLYSSRSDITTRGAGRGVTIFKSAGNAGAFFLTSSESNDPDPDQNIVSGATAGSTAITVSDASTFHPGSRLVIYPNGLPIWAHNLGGFADTFGGAMAMSFRVVSVDTGTDVVTFEPPLPFNYSSLGLTIIARPLNGTMVHNTGFEDFTMDMTESTATGPIRMTGCYGCWVKGVEIKGAWTRQMWFDKVIRCEVRKCLTIAARGSGPNHEGIDFSADACFNLVEDNICSGTGAMAIIFGDGLSASSGNVIAYNYVVDSQAGWWDISFSHGGHNMFNLAEGNVIRNYKDDGYFGSSSDNTLFRNRISEQTVFKHFATYYNVVGNVLGLGWFNAYEVEVSNYYGVGISPIFELGYPNIGNVCFVDTIGPTTPPDYHLLENVLYVDNPCQAGGTQQHDLNVKGTILRHGNYDYVNVDILWDPAIADHSLPDSLYTTKAETEARGMNWTVGDVTVPFPPIDPTNPSAETNPAKERYLAEFGVPAAPVNTVAPTITGTATTGSTLTAHTGAWTGNPFPTFIYQWQLCDTSCNVCDDISGATNSTYVIQVGDEDSKILLLVLGTNAHGDDTGVSLCTDIITAPTGPTVPFILWRP